MEFLHTLNSIICFVLKSYFKDIFSQIFNTNLVQHQTFLWYKGFKIHAIIRFKFDAFLIQEKVSNISKTKNYFNLNTIYITIQAKVLIKIN